MAHIAEPKGVDFLIQSPPLTNKEREELSEFIKKRKAETKTKIKPKRKTRKMEKPTISEDVD